MGDMSQCPSERDSRRQPRCPFRFFTLRSLDDRGNLRIKLHQARSCKDIEYDAISYSWEDQEATIKIDCGRGDFRFITPALYEALCVYYRRPRRFALWADCICVDQRDNSDKARQVRMMGDYFRYAESVLIWLGPSTYLSNLAFDHLHTLIDGFRRYSYKAQQLAEDHILESAGLPLEGQPLWHGIGDLISRRWFSRLWVVQEAVVARSAVVICGNRTAPLRDVLEMGFALSESGLDRWVECPPPFKSMKQLERIKLIHQSIRVYPKVLTPVDLMRMARNQETTEQVDKIYAIIELMDTNIGRNILIDYSPESRRNYCNHYIALAHQILQRPGGLNLLTEASSEHRPPELPTWCPNFDCSRQMKRFPYHRYRAGGREMHEARVIGLSRHAKQITIRGVPFGTLWHAEVYPVVMNKGSKNSGAQEKLCLWLQRCRTLAQLALKTNEPGPEEFLRTIVANSIPYPTTYWPALSDLQLALQIAIPHWPHGTSEIADVRTAATWGRFETALSSSCPGRALFTTNTGKIGPKPCGFET